MTAAAETTKEGANGSGREEIENWLESNGVTEYSYKPKLSLNKIDARQSRSNQARPLHPIDEDWVIVIAEAYAANPAVMPPIVVEQLPGGKFKILDGNHRHTAALMLDMTTLPAYVITQKLTETQERMLAITANQRHGLSVDLDTRVRHALWLVEARGMKVVEAARVVGAPEHRVSQMVQLERATRRAAAVDHRAPTKLSAGARQRLDNIRNDNVHEALTKLAIETSMGQADVNSLVTAINKQSTETKQLAVIEGERKRREKEILASAGGKVPMPLAYRNLRGTLSRAVRIDVKAVLDAKADPELRKQVKAQAKEAITALQKLVEAL